VPMNPQFEVAGFDATLENLRAYSDKMQKNIERKAMRQTMQRIRKWEKRIWKNYPVKKSSLEWGKSETKTYKSGRTKQIAAYSIRKAAAKAVTVKVGTKRKYLFGHSVSKVAGYDVYGRVFLRYSKKNAGAAKMAHFLEMDRKGHKGKHRIQAMFNATRQRIFDTFAAALDVYIQLPNAKAKAVREKIF
jgi:hypothetical protein